MGPLVGSVGFFRTTGGDLQLMLICPRWVGDGILFPPDTQMRYRTVKRQITPQRDKKRISECEEAIVVGGGQKRERIM